MASLLRKAARAVVTIVESELERWGDPARKDLLSKELREERERSARIVERNQQLEDDWHLVQRQMDELLDKYSFNGPTLYRNEVEALKSAIRALSDYDDHHDPKAVTDIEGLLSRSDHLPMTEKELAVTIHGVVSGDVKTLAWDEMFNDAKFDPENVPTDDEEFNG